MKVSGTAVIGAPQPRVFAGLMDPAVLQRSIAGCEKLVQTGENTYDAHLSIGVAGMKGKYVGKVQLQDVRPPDAYTLIVEGKGGPGFVRGNARFTLAPQGEKTAISCEADVQVGGLIAAVGSRLIEATARKALDQFFRDFEAALAATP